LFNDREDYGEYLKSLAEYKKEYGFRLYAFNLLPKRLCLLIELQNNVTISTIMHNLNTKYTKSYNGRYGKKGHLFQSRFKSQLIEKEDHLLRLTRYIHLLPRDLGFSQAIIEHPYSSFMLYVGNQEHGELGLLDVGEEIKEVLSYFPQLQDTEDQHRAYVGYVRSAGVQEMEAVRKLLHRRAFVGSREFVEAMHKKVKEHVKEEERSHVIRRPSAGLVMAGSFIVLFLSIAAYSFYSHQAKLQDTLDIATSGMGAARDELAKRVNTLQNELVVYVEKENHGLGGLAWELKLTPVQQEHASESYTDRLRFKGGQVISTVMLAKGFASFDYTIEEQTHGKKVWQTVQTSPDGTTVRWYGIISGDKMRGVLIESPVEGQSRDFSFVSVRRVQETGRAQNVVQ
jgi:REP element-mobilizing transposase RayT